MRETRSSGSVEGVMGNHDSYSDSFEPVGYDAQRRTELDAKIGGRWHERPLSEPIAPCPAPPSQERSVSSRGSLRQFDPTVELIVGILTPRLEPIARFILGIRSETLRIGWVLLFRSVRLLANRERSGHLRIDFRYCLQ